MNNIIRITFLFCILSACIPDHVEEKLGKTLQFGTQLFADQEFKKAISYIELHKIRTGSYPNKLSDLKHLSLLDSSLFQYVDYTRLDSVYELNLIFEVHNVDGTVTNNLPSYPPDFWQGLGCVKSNLR